MVDDLDIFQAKLDQLKKEFARHLPSKIDQIYGQWLTLRNEDLDAGQLSELLNLVHKIAGSGGMFGFSCVSEVACKIESVLQDAIRMKKPMTNKEMNIMDDYLKELDEAVRSCNE
jgi:chemotaxis protein histidine kinase CheA